MSTTTATVASRALAEGRDELTRDEARRYVEQQTEAHFGLSVDKFVAAARDGTLDPDDPFVLHLALMTGVKLDAC